METATSTHESTERLERRPAPAPSRRRAVVWTLIVSALLFGAAFVAFVELVHDPLVRRAARLEDEVSELETQRDDAADRTDVLERERDEAIAERDALRAERDALLARTGELSGTLAEREARIAELVAAQASLEEQLHAEIEAGNVTVEERGGRLSVRLADQVLFASGSADLSDRGREVLRHVADSLRRFEGRRIVVEGHTDSTPLTGESLERFGSNWELSTARATEVVRFFAEECEIPGERLVASGRAEFDPVGDNDTPAGRRHNRRIEIGLAPAE